MNAPRSNDGNGEDIMWSSRIRSKCGDLLCYVFFLILLIPSLACIYFLLRLMPQVPANEGWEWYAAVGEMLVGAILGFEGIVAVFHLHQSRLDAREAANATAIQVFNQIISEISHSEVRAIRHRLLKSQIDTSLGFLAVSRG